MVLVKPEAKGYTYYKTPKYADVPYSEWKSRIARVQELMKGNGVDCLTVWMRENLRYFFGFQSIHWYTHSIQPAVGIIPANGEPILIVPGLFQGVAEGTCWARDIRWQEQAHQPRIERELPREIAGIIEEIGCGKKRVALESGPLGCIYIPRPVNDIDMLRNSLPNAKFVDGDKVIWGARMIKSPLEIDRIRTSVQYIAAVELAIVEGYRPGMTEVDLLKVINSTQSNLPCGLGDDPIGWDSFICGREKSPLVDVSALDGVTITKDSAIIWDGAAPYKGYTPDHARIWQVGPVTKEAKKAYENVFRAQDAAENILRPGIRANDLFEAMYKEAKASGRAEWITMGGHGTGLDMHEPPSIDESNDMTIEEGMTLSIEPWFPNDEGIMFGIQDTFVVTRNGCEKLEGLRRDIIQVSHPSL